MDNAHKLSSTIRQLVRHIHELREKVVDIVSDQEVSIGQQQQREEFIH